jgi:hypothetical protein
LYSNPDSNNNVNRIKSPTSAVTKHALLDDIKRIDEEIELEHKSFYSLKNEIERKQNEKKYLS